MPDKKIFLDEDDLIRIITLKFGSIENFRKLLFWHFTDG